MTPLVALMLVADVGVASGTEEIVILRDQSSGRFIRVDIGSGTITAGLMVMVDPNAGLAWTADPIDVDPQVDGSVDISYDGDGYLAGDASVDPLTGRLSLGTSAAASVDLEVSGTIDDGRTTGEVTVEIDSVPFVIDDAPPTVSAGAFIDGVLADLEAADWEALYDALHPSLRAAIGEEDTVEAFEATEALGDITDATLVGSPSVAAAVTGFDSATFVVDLSFADSGCTAVYRTEFHGVLDGSWYLSDLGAFEPDEIPPTSTVDAPARYVDSPSVALDITSFDDRSGICVIDLWGGYVDDPVLVEADAGDPANIVIDWPLELLAFETVAMDGARNQEAAPATPDTYVVWVPPYGDLFQPGFGVGYWPLADPSGTTAVDAVGSSDGTYSGGVTLEVMGPSAFIETGISLDGSDDVLLLPVDLPAGDPWDLSFWARFPTGLDDTAILFAGDDNTSTTAWGLYADGPDLTVVQHPSDVVVASFDISSFDTAVWHHFRLSHAYEGSTTFLDLAVDGQSVSGEESSTALDGFLGPLRFGFEGHASNYLRAEIAAVAWGDENAPLPDYVAEAGRPYRAIYGWTAGFGNALWTLEEAPGSTARDHQGSEADAVAVNGAALGAGGPGPAVPSAASLDGVDDYFSITGDWDEVLTDDLVLAAWVRGDSWAQPVNAVIGQGTDGPLLYVDDEGRVTFAVGGGM